MKLKLLSLLFTIFISNTIIGQSLNDYKYIIIPSKYEFLKFEDQHKLNSLTKFLFEKEGFKTIYDNVERPADLSNNPCLGLTAGVFNDSGMFTTKLTIELTNCKNQKVVTSQVGKSKEKDYKKGFQEALRNAFKSVSALNYTYANKNVKVAAPKQKTPPAAPETIKVVEEAEGVTSNQIEEVIEETVVSTEEVEENSIDGIQEGAVDTNKNRLYAQANALGYQLVDSTPKVVYVLLKSSKPDVYFLRNKKGIVYKENGQWVVEYYDLDKLVKEEVTIKF